MRRYLILASAILGLMGVAADQLAFRVDRQVSALQKDREEFIDWQRATASLMVELNNVRQRLFSAISVQTLISREYEKIIEYDAIYFSEYVLTDEDWVKNDDYEDVAAIDITKTSENLVALRSIFDGPSVRKSELGQVLELTSELHKGLLIEIVNLDESIWWNRDQELKLEFRRQVLLLTAIVSSLLSVLSVLLYVRTQA